jgi:surface protein
MTNYDESLTNYNITHFVQMYILDKSQLPDNLQKQIGEWDVSNVTNMKNLFSNWPQFNEPLNHWDVSNVTNMEGMFCNCTNFNQPLNDWNVSNVTNMKIMFGGCEKFNQPLDNWNVSNVTDMNHMFYNCINFNQSLNNWNVSNVTDMEYMFCNCTIFNQLLSNWNFSYTRKQKNVFHGCINFKSGAQPRPNRQMKDNSGQLSNTVSTVIDNSNSAAIDLIVEKIETNHAVTTTSKQDKIQDEIKEEVAGIYRFSYKTMTQSLTNIDSHFYKIYSNVTILEVNGKNTNFKVGEFISELCIECSMTY